MLSYLENKFVRLTFSARTVWLLRGRSAHKWERSALADLFLMVDSS
jgi:hypothetical protein